MSSMQCIIMERAVENRTLYWIKLGSVLSISCNNHVAELHIDKFASGSHGRCIKEDEFWLTPEEFEAKSGLALAGDWSRSIRCGTNSLKDLIDASVLSLNNNDCGCDECQAYRDQPMDVEPSTSSEQKRKRIRHEDQSKRRRLSTPPELVEFSQMSSWSVEHRAFVPVPTRPAHTSTATSTSTSAMQTDAMASNFPYMPGLYYNEGFGQEEINVPILPINTQSVLGQSQHVSIGTQMAHERDLHSTLPLTTNEIADIPSCTMCRVPYKIRNECRKKGMVLHSASCLHSSYSDPSDESTYGATSIPGWYYPTITSDRFNSRQQFGVATVTDFTEPPLFMPVRQEPIVRVSPQPIRLVVSQIPREISQTQVSEIQPEQSAIDAQMHTEDQDEH